MLRRSFKYKFVLFTCLMGLMSALSVVALLSIIDTNTINVINQNLIIFVGLLAVLVLCCLIVSHLFFYRSFRAFINLSSFTVKVRKTKDYSLRVQPQGGLELFTLGENINDMLENLHSESELNRLNSKRLMEAKLSMDRMAQFDSLTGLPNRQSFMKSLESTLAMSKNVSQNMLLLCFDLDGFRAVNDIYGHKVGDALLVEAGRRASGVLRQGELIARLGGDEFLLLFYLSSDEVTANNIAKRLAYELSLPYLVGTWQLEVTASIGLAMAADSGFDSKEFVGNAEIAMYRSKERGCGHYTMFTASMKEQKKRRLDIANALNQAIVQNELHLAYQAKVNAEDDVVGYEALIRWNSASLGFVPPDEFIQIAEQSGKISQITFWVLETLCKDIDTFISQHGQDVKVSFNLSAHDLKDPQLSCKIEMLLKRYNVDGRNLEVEVTESVYLDNFITANRFFEDMTKLNCSIALDDFGTGYSSLSYLTQINIDTLKVDKQFVDHIVQSSKSKLVTKAIIEMGKQLGLNICAEGVESQDQAKLLKFWGCHELQGYFYSKPSPISQLFTLD